MKKQNDVPRAHLENWSPKLETGRARHSVGAANITNSRSISSRPDGAHGVARPTFCRNRF